MQSLCSPSVQTAALIIRFLIGIHILFRRSDQIKNVGSSAAGTSDGSNILPDGDGISEPFNIGIKFILPDILPQDYKFIAADPENFRKQKMFSEKLRKAQQQRISGSMTKIVVCGLQSVYVTKITPTLEPSVHPASTFS